MYIRCILNWNISWDQGSLEVVVDCPCFQRMTAGLAREVAHLWVALGIFQPAAIVVAGAA